MVKPEYCDKCGYVVSQCECEKPKTNADRIRSMSDEELADAMLNLNEIGDHISFCVNAEKCDEIMENGGLIPDGMCRQCLIKWLQSEVEEN